MKRPSTEPNLQILNLTHLDTPARATHLCGLLYRAVCLRYSPLKYVQSKVALEYSIQAQGEYSVNLQVALGSARTDRQISSGALTGVARYCPAWRGSGRRLGVSGWKLNERKRREMQRKINALRLGVYSMFQIQRSRPGL